MNARRRRRPSLRLYLLALVTLFGLAAAIATTVQRDRLLRQAEDTTAERVTFLAHLGGDAVADAVRLTRRSVAEVAANPGLAQLFATPDVPGCSLTFTGAGPFTEGYIDIVDARGVVRCSSRSVPDGPVHEGAPWLQPDGDPAVTTVEEPRIRRPGIMVTAPIDGLGVVATFLGRDGLATELGQRFGGPLDVRFRVGEGDTVPAADDEIAGRAEVPTLGWTVLATADRAPALADARSLGRQTWLFLAAGLLVLLAATLLVHRQLARPIGRLSGAVRAARRGEGSSELPRSGPSEVASLAEDFSALSAEVTVELERREAAEQEARRSERSWRTLFAAHPIPMWIYDTDTLAVLEVNDAAVAEHGYAREEFLAMTVADLRPPEDVAALQELVRGAAVLERSGPWHHLHKDGTRLDVEITSHAVTFEGRPARFVMAEDVSQRERTQRLLLQAQRMESLGQLAGGIAHDFNNVLAVMLTYTEFAVDELTEAAAAEPQRWAPVLRDVEGVARAGERAAGLTRQLLAFARGESTDVAPLDIDEVVTGIEPMLRRTLGAHIELEVGLGPDIPPVVANAGQVEQVLVNLAVNARDAMPAGGALTIETDVVVIDEEAAPGEPELTPGRYARLRVSDTGTGMPPEVRDRAFEPLFTTKERGSGTGFGLATVYGVVSRARGTVRIYSEPGFGTTVSVLLPAAETSQLEAVEPVAVSRNTGTETILVVEDDAEVRAVTERILVAAGYRVLTAADGNAALEVATGGEGSIDLVLTDVVMPGMLGSELVRRLREQRPDLRVLLMSGYAPPVLVTGGNLEPGAPLLDKPFSSNELRQKVRYALDAS